MDKKIEEAMIQATNTSEFCSAYYYWPPQYVEKFALLIARLAADAADMAREADCKYPGDYVMESLGFSCTDR